MKRAFLTTALCALLPIVALCVVTLDGVPVETNPTYGDVAAVESIARAGTNAAQQAQATADAALPASGGRMTGGIFSDEDYLAAAPAADELPTAEWVRSLAMQGREWFFTATTTNGYGEKTANLVALSAEAQNQFTNSIASPVASSTYLAGGVATELFGSVRSPITFEIYMNRVGGNTSTVIPVHPEIYYVYNGTTNHLGDWESANQTVTATTPTKYTFTVAFTEPSITGSVYIIGYLKSGTVSGSAAGLNIYGGGIYPSHMDIEGVPAGESAADVLAALGATNTALRADLLTKSATNGWQVGSHAGFVTASITNGLYPASNPAGYVTAAITNGLLASESDPAWHAGTGAVYVAIGNAQATADAAAPKTQVSTQVWSHVQYPLAITNIVVAGTNYNGGSVTLPEIAGPQGPAGTNGADGAGGVWTQSVTVTVGPTGTYQTINAALTYLTAKYPVHDTNSVKATIELQSGYTNSGDQVVADGIDLGWITITQADGVESTHVVADGLYGLRTDPDNSGYAVLFLALEGGVLPVIRSQFHFDVCTVVDPSLLHGVSLWDGSRAVIIDGGVSSAGVAVRIARGSSIVCSGAKFTDSLTHTLWATEVSTASCEGTDFSSTNSVPLEATRGTVASLSFCDLQGVEVSVSEGSTVNANDITGGTLNQTPNTLTQDGVIYQNE